MTVVDKMVSSFVPKAIVAAIIGFAFLLTMVDRVHLPGDHVSFLVLAPYPTLFDHYGGESVEAWHRKHPGEALPWWLKEEYLILMEVTDG